MPEAVEVVEGAAGARVIRVRSDYWPERDRIELFRQQVGRDRITVEQVENNPLRIDAMLMKVPGLGLVSARRSALRSDFADGNDRLTFNFGSDSLASQSGREFLLKRGDAVAFTGNDVGSFINFQCGRLATIEFPNGALARMLHDPGAACHIPANAPALLMLRGYVRSLLASGGMSLSALQPLAVAHVHDLAALALSTGREAREIGRGRGVRSARLQAIKADILARLDGEISTAAVAARHRLSPRYVRMLFESEGTSFSEFVREERLKRARAMLLSRRFDHLGIAAIAYEVGFNDLSYFNRSFRRRFGHSPGEMREIGLAHRD